MRTFIDRHLEGYLGRVTKGWSSLHEPSGVQVCLFADQPTSGVLTYTTLGLSDHVLTMPMGRSLRQELLLSMQTRFGSDDVAKMLLEVAAPIVSGHRALLRGDVVALGYPLVRGSACCDLYVSLPVVFPDGLATYEKTEPATVCAWLIPITKGEASFVRANGWSAFEDALERVNADLFDLHRRSVVGDE